ncbi:hypothetical protein HFP57_02940 [Parasphingopyxis algicola]|uniref:hypothetical protein n=1 Tax=Parasphingopyxis algicola TaxID=2026624 RepID=UPI0015A1D965|nr:hypothetical protein [Parasphingopyxis algicola]QLC24087.1 hypothetical protein HFP57_02940 [Parasphingopyxis algicola]
MSFGPADGHQILIVPPLFEELNRTRKLLSDLMRALAGRGIATHLPDLPGTGESEAQLPEIQWTDWRHAVDDAAKASDATEIFAVRGGCLLDDVVPALPHMRFSPGQGKSVIRDLIRSRSLNDPDFDSAAQKAVFTDGPTLLGGYPVSAALASAVRDADIADLPDVRTIRLETEHGDADRQIAGPPLWRRAEPTGSAELTDALTTAIAEWTG